MQEVFSNKKAIKLVLLTVLLSACVPIPYIPLHPEVTGEDLSGIQVGSTTRKEIFTKLGEASVLDEEGYYLTTLDSRSPGVVLLIPTIETLAFPPMLTGANFIRVLIAFDKADIVRRFKATGMTLSITRWPTLMSGPKTQTKEIETDHLSSAGNNVLLNLKYRATLNRGEKGSKVIFSPNGKWLVGLNKYHIHCGFEISRASVWKVEKIVTEGVTSPEYNIDNAGFIGISPDSKHFAIWKDDTLQIGRLDSFQYQTPLSLLPLEKSVNPQYPTCPFNHSAFGQGAELDFSPDGNLFALIRKKTVPLKIYEHFVEIRQTGGEFLSSLKAKDEGSSYTVNDVKFLPNSSNRVATLGCYDPWFGAVDCHVKLWEVNTGKEIRSMSISANGEYFINQDYFKMPTANMAISPDGFYLATRGYDSKKGGDLLKLWSLPEGNLLAERLLPKDPSNSRHLLFSSDGKLATMMSPGFILIFNYLHNPDERSTRLPASKANKITLERIDQVIQLPYSCVPVFDTKKPGIKEKRPRKLFFMAKGDLGVKCADAGLVVYDTHSSQMVTNYSFFYGTPYDVEIMSNIPGSEKPQKINDIEISPDLKQVGVATDDGFFLMDIDDAALLPTFREDPRIIDAKDKQRK